jgi:hypothetical protein
MDSQLGSAQNTPQIHKLGGQRHACDSGFLAKNHGSYLQSPAQHIGV